MKINKIARNYFYFMHLGVVLQKHFYQPGEKLTDELNTETYNVDLEENKEISNVFNI